MKTLNDLRFIQGLDKNKKVLAVSIDSFKDSIRVEMQEKIDLLKKKISWRVQKNDLQIRILAGIKLDENDLQLMHEVSYCLRKFNFDLDEFDWG